jgi:hypothetical protein
MVLFLAGELPVLVCEPGTIMARSGGVAIQVPTLPLAPDLEVTVLREDDELPDDLPRVQLRLDA